MGTDKRRDWIALLHSFNLIRDNPFHPWLKFFGFSNKEELLWGQSSHCNMLEFCWKIFIAITIGSAVSGQQRTSRIFAIALASLAKMSISGMPIYGIPWYLCYRFGFHIDGLGFLRPRSEPVRWCQLS